jgi:adenine/guanine phosphoribosyltransferase-like PRPP-binding protein
MRTINVTQASEILQKSPEQVRRILRARKLGGRKAKINEWEIEEYETRIFRIKEAGIKVLDVFESFTEFKEKLIPQIDSYFDNQPACIMAIEPDGIPYALVLFLHFNGAKDVTFTCLGEETFRDPDLVKNRKVLLVDDCTRTGGSFKLVKDKLESAAALNVKAVKLAVYDDLAELSKQREYRGQIFAVKSRDYKAYRNNTEENINDLIAKASG